MTTTTTIPREIILETAATSLLEFVFMEQVEAIVWILGVVKLSYVT